MADLVDQLPVSNDLMKGEDLYCGSSTQYENAEENDRIEDTDKSRPLYKNGRYINPWPEWNQYTKKRTTHGLNFVSSKFLSFFTKWSQASQIRTQLPVIPLNGEHFKTVDPSTIKASWIGHASVLIQMDGITFLTDPIFSHRYSANGMPLPGARFIKCPSKVSELPHIDVVVLSHNHYDHLDFRTVSNINHRFGSDLRWLVPAGMKGWLTSCRITNVTELNWWDSVAINSVDFICTPCQHWSTRNGYDRNRSLWCSWAVIGPTCKFYFGGDTGYCQAFRQIGHHLGPFHLAALPVGACEPRAFLRRQHINIEEAVRIMKELKTEFSLGVHWGTFDLGAEAFLAPISKVPEQCLLQDVDPRQFLLPNHGAVFKLTIEEGRPSICEFLTGKLLVNVPTSEG